MIETKTGVIDRELSLQERRDFVKLPLDERRRRMAEQAAHMATHYAGPNEVLERQAWQGGDIVECS